MISTLHAIATFHANVRTDIRIAHEAGYCGYEILETKLLRYLDQGYQAEDLLPLFVRYQVQPVCINGLKDVESIAPDEHRQLIAEAERLCQAAETLHFPTLQLVCFDRLKGRPWAEVLEITAGNVAEIADIGRQHGVRMQLEPVAWSPVHSLAKSLEVISAAGRDNVGLVIDFWHLWAGGETRPEEVAKLDPGLIYGVHFCDGKRPLDPGKTWDETALRSFLPGEGDVPIEDWVEAVKVTGFDGSWSAELISPRHWEWDLLEIAVTTRKLLEQYTGSDTGDGDFKA